jgi:hypothetical protein
MSRLELFGYIAMGLEMVFGALIAVAMAVTYERLRESKEGLRPGELDKIFE